MSPVQRQPADLFSQNTTQQASGDDVCQILAKRTNLWADVALVLQISGVIMVCLKALSSLQMCYSLFLFCFLGVLKLWQRTDRINLSPVLVPSPNPLRCDDAGVFISALGFRVWVLKLFSEQDTNELLSLSGHTVFYCCEMWGPTTRKPTAHFES